MHYGLNNRNQCLTIAFAVFARAPSRALAGVAAVASSALAGAGARALVAYNNREIKYSTSLIL